MNSPIEDKLEVKEKKSKRERTDKSPKGYGKRQPQTIQSQSIFEQGPMDHFVKRGRPTTSLIISRQFELIRYADYTQDF